LVRLFSADFFEILAGIKLAGKVTPRL